MPSLYDAERRHAQYYVSVFRSTDDLYSRGGEFIGRALATFDLEFINIWKGQEWASKNLENSEEAARCLLAEGHCLGWRLPAQENIIWLEHSLRASQLTHSRELEGIKFGNLGSSHMMIGDAKQALYFTERSLNIARELQNRKMEGAALGVLGMIHAGEWSRLRRRLQQGEVFHLDLPTTTYSLEKELKNYSLEKALVFYQQRLAIAREIDDRVGEANGLVELGAAYSQKGYLALAMESFNRALVIARKTGEWRTQFEALTNLGVAYKMRGEAYRSLEISLQALSVATRLGSSEHELWNIAVHLQEYGGITEAITVGEAALDKFRMRGNKFSSYVETYLNRWRQQNTRNFRQRWKGAGRAVALGIVGGLAVGSGYWRIVITMVFAASKGLTPIFPDMGVTIVNDVVVVKFPAFTISYAIAGFVVLAVCLSRISSKRKPWWQVILLSATPFLLGYGIVRLCNALRTDQTFYPFLVYLLVLSCCGFILGLLLPRPRMAFVLLLVSPISFIVASFLSLNIIQGASNTSIGTTPFITQEQIPLLITNEATGWAIIWLIYSLILAIVIWQLDVISYAKLLRKGFSEVSKVISSTSVPP